MGQTGLLVKLVDGNKDCEWIFRFRANPGRPWGGIVPPSPVLAPGSALGWRPRGALSPPPPPQCNPGEADGANAFLVLARRRASACASFSRRVAQIASACPANLSAGVM